MAVAATAAARVERHMRTRQRKRGHPTVQITFRCPKELTDLVDQLGSDRTEGVVRLLDIAKDVRDVLADKVADVEVRAYREQITEGESYGRYAVEGIQAERKSKR